MRKSAICMASKKMSVYVQFNLARFSIIKQKSFDSKINLKLKFIKHLELEAMIVRNLNGLMRLLCAKCTYLLPKTLYNHFSKKGVSLMSLGFFENNKTSLHAETYNGGSQKRGKRSKLCIRKGSFTGRQPFGEMSRQLQACSVGTRTVGGRGCGCNMTSGKLCMALEPEV